VGEANLRTEYAFVLPLMVFNEICGCPPDLGERLVAGMSGIIGGVDAENANQILGQAVAELVALKRREPDADVVSWPMAHPAQLNDEGFAGDLSGGSLVVEDALDEVLWTDPPIAIRHRLSRTGPRLPRGPARPCRRSSRRLRRRRRDGRVPSRGGGTAIDPLKRSPEARI
jgi:hypothetical protein